MYHVKCSNIATSFQLIHRRLFRDSMSLAKARSDRAFFSSSSFFRRCSFSFASLFFSSSCFCRISAAFFRSSAAFLFRSANFAFISLMVLSRNSRRTGSLSNIWPLLPWLLFWFTRRLVTLGENATGDVGIEWDTLSAVFVFSWIFFSWRNRLKGLASLRWQYLQIVLFALSSSLSASFAEPLSFSTAISFNSSRILLEGFPTCDSWSLSSDNDE